MDVICVCPLRRHSRLQVLQVRAVGRRPRRLLAGAGGLRDPGGHFRRRRVHGEHGNVGGGSPPRRHPRDGLQGGPTEDFTPEIQGDWWAHIWPGWVDYDFGHSSVCLVLLVLMGIWQNRPVNRARWWNIKNQSQPNQGTSPPESPCRSIMPFERCHTKNKKISVKLHIKYFHSGEKFS